MENTLNQKEKGNGLGESVHGFSDALTAARENIGPNLKNAFVDSAQRLSTLASEAGKSMVATSRDASKTVDRHVHSQPWAYIARAGLAGLALGYFLFKRK